MKLIVGIVAWALFAVVRSVMIVFGAVVAVPLSLVGDGAYHTPRMWRLWANIDRGTPISGQSRYRKYVEFAWRNPTPGLDGLIKQPIPEVQPNPDVLVRLVGRPSAHRFMWCGIFWEYWYLSKVGGRYFEFRVGWKFVDGNDDFVPTFQFGIKK